MYVLSSEYCGLFGVTANLTRVKLAFINLKTQCTEISVASLFCEC